jgi:imidazolonepropionase
MPATLILRNAKTILTCAGPAPRRGPAQADVSPIRQGSVVSVDGTIVFVGPSAECHRQHPTADGATVIDAAGCSVVPGFVDPPTHLVFAGDRREELR